MDRVADLSRTLTATPPLLCHVSVLARAGMPRPPRPPAIPRPRPGRARACETWCVRERFRPRECRTPFCWQPPVKSPKRRSSKNKSAPATTTRTNQPKSTARMARHRLLGIHTQTPLSVCTRGGAACDMLLRCDKWSHDVAEQRASL